MTNGVSDRYLLAIIQVDKLKMTEMWSQQGEKVAFEKPVEAKGNFATCFRPTCQHVALDSRVGHGLSMNKLVPLMTQLRDLDLQH